MGDETRCTTGVQSPARRTVPRRVALERAGAFLALGSAAALRGDAARGLVRLLPWLGQHEDNPTLEQHKDNPTLDPAPETPL